MAARRQLSTTQRIAVRALADQETTPLGETNVQHRTLVSLRQRGIARYVEAERRWELTRHGQSWHEHIMESGDGPEHLKAMLRFGGGR